VIHPATLDFFLFSRVSQKHLSGKLSCS